MECYAGRHFQYFACMTNINECIAIGGTAVTAVSEKSYDKEIHEDTLHPISCNFCSEKIDQINSYRCATCTEAAGDDSNSSNGAKSVLCEGCIWVLHIKQKHKVLDWRGHEPVICDLHTMLSLMFCCDCSVMFCFKCLGSHCNHVFKPAHEKATELREFVFEYLNNFEEMAKPLKNRVRAVKDILDEREKFAKSLDQEHLTTTLLKSFKQVAEINAAKWSKLFSEATKSDPEFSGENCIRTNCYDAICAVSNVADEMVLQLRDVLQMSDGRCIKTYLDNLELFDASLNMQNVEFETHVSLRWDPTLDDYMANAIETVLRQLREPLGHRRIYEIYKLSKGLSGKDKQYITLSEIFPEKGFKPSAGFTSCSEVFNISCSEDKVNLSVLLSKPDIRGKAFNDNWNVFNYCFDINGVKSVFRSGCYLVFYKSDSFLSVFNLQSGKYTGCRKILDNIEPMKFECNGSSVVWNSVKSQVELSKEDGTYEALPCLKRPKLLASFGSAYAFVSGDKMLTVYNIATKLKVEVLPIHHGMSQIDNLNFQDSEERLILFDYTKSVSLTCRVVLADFTSRSWIMEKLWKYEISTEEPITHFCAIGSRVFAITDTSFFS